jgi:hypothetical protein
LPHAARLKAWTVHAACGEGRDLAKDAAQGGRLGRFQFFSWWSPQNSIRTV